MKNGKLFGLQLFAEAVAGKKIVYLYRILSTEKDHDATALAFTTENERTKSKDADSTVTKDGTVRTPGAAEGEITASSLLKKGDKFIDELEAALDDDEKMEIWEVNLAEPQASSTDKFKAKYFQGYLTEIDKTSNAEDNVELSLTFGLGRKRRRWLCNGYCRTAGSSSICICRYSEDRSLRGREESSSF